MTGGMICPPEEAAERGSAEAGTLGHVGLPQRFKKALVNLI